MVRKIGLRHRLRETRARCFAHLAGALLAAASAPLFVGCQGGPRVNGYIEQMAAERRALENRVYELEYDLEVVQSELDHERSENDRLRGGDGASGKGSTGLTPRSPPPPRRTPPRTSGPAASGARSAPDDALLKPPVIEPGDYEGELETPALPPAGNAPPAKSPPANVPPTLGPPAVRKPLPPPAAPPAELKPPAAADEPLDQPLNPPAEVEDEPAAPPANGRSMLPPPLAPTVAISDAMPDDDVSGDERSKTPSLEEDAVIEVPLASEPPEVIEPESPVASVKLLAEPTGGVDLDDKPGDDGVTVAFQLRDERGRLVRLPGPVSVVVLDLAQKGPAARVARWDLDAEQVARLLPDGPSEEGLVLHMAWPGDPPKREQLQLHIRYITPEGRKLEDHRDIAIRLPGQRVSDSRPGRSEVIQAGGWRPKSPSDARSAVVPAAATSPRR
ncbi:MAG: hypothetical protein U0939_19995 [Pirellulales bacterium]